MARGLGGALHKNSGRKVSAGRHPARILLTRSVLVDVTPGRGHTFSAGRNLLCVCLFLKLIDAMIFTPPKMPAQGNVQHADL